MQNHGARPISELRSLRRRCQDRRHGTQDRHQRVHRGRGPGRADARHGPGLTRHRRDRDRDQASGRAAERQMQPGVGALDGGFPPPRACRKNPRHRPAGRIPQRRVVLYRGDRRRAFAHQAAVACRPHARRKGRRRLVADRGMATPDQSAVPRTAAVRACGRHSRASASSTARSSRRSRRTNTALRATLAISTAATALRSAAAISSAATAAARRCVTRWAPSLRGSRNISACNRPISARPRSRMCFPASRPGCISRSIRAAAAP